MSAHSIFSEEYLHEIRSLDALKQYFVESEQRAPIVFDNTELNKQLGGVYRCTSCKRPLYSSMHQQRVAGVEQEFFFDTSLSGAVQKKGMNTNDEEIVCAHCGVAIGHLTLQDNMALASYHSVLSACVEFDSASVASEVFLGSANQHSAHHEAEIALFAGGCFWNLEFFFLQEKGVVSVISGYSGGNAINPKYTEVCAGVTGHAEAVLVMYDKNQTSFETLTKHFFEVHDPTIVHAEAPHYRSVIFYMTEEQRRVGEQLIDDLKERGYGIQTELEPANMFYPAEGHLQNYLKKHPLRPHCRSHVKRFEK